jgi:biotin-(acetyl-CoA carboxylase) ligase
MMKVMEGRGGENWHSLKASMVSSMVLKADSTAGEAWAEGILLWWLWLPVVSALF